MDLLLNNGYQLRPHTYIIFLGPGVIMEMSKEHGGRYQRTPALLRKRENKTAQRFVHCPSTSQGRLSRRLRFHRQVNI